MNLARRQRRLGELADQALRDGPLRYQYPAPTADSPGSVAGYFLPMVRAFAVHCYNDTPAGREAFLRDCLEDALRIVRNEEVEAVEALREQRP